MNLLKMSLSGGIMVLAVIILRSILLNRFPKRVFVLFWTIVLMRLLIPFQINSVFSIFSFVNKYFVGENKTVYTAGKFIPVQTAEMVFENTYNNSSRNFFTISPIMILWFIGMAVTFIVFACIYRNCRWNIKISLPVKNDYIIHWIETHRLRRTLNIRVSENIKSPLTFGIFKPVSRRC